ncbi:MAG TPA: hypothetical protein VHB70_18675 [Parafilimonas sp.]|nr:hypothetical protein [Parafilimonas sp.]
MEFHKADNHIVPAQLLCFVFSLLCLIQSFFIPPPITEILVRFKDSFFITGTTLLSIKLARDGWEMAASGFIILTIGWGVLFTATDYLGENTGYINLASAFYFVAPSMVLMAYYKPFNFWIKLLLIINIIPFLLSVALKIAQVKGSEIIYLSVINILFIHFVSLVWSIYFFLKHKKLKRITNQITSK